MRWRGHDGSSGRLESTDGPGTDRSTRLPERRAAAAGLHRRADDAQSAPRHEKRRRIEAVLADPALIDFVYQPIVDTEHGTVSAVEALARFRPEPGQGPDRWFADAAEVELAVPLELLAIQRAAELADDLPGEFLAVNVSPQTILAPEFIPVITGLRIPTERLVLEVTEHAGIESYDSFGEALDRLRSRGLRIAVDDAGAGYASFQHILELHPDFIKLDHSIVRGIDRDPARRALARAMAEFASDIGSTVIAEGVERIDELRALTSAGIVTVQGYLCGRPSAVPVPPPTMPEIDPAPGVLIVDDDAIVRMLLTRIVRSSGLRLIGQATDGEEAIRCASAMRPDVVILDLSMPRLAGADALPTLRRLLPEAAIIVLSSDTTKVYDVNLLTAGADALIGKDDTAIRLTEILTRIARWGRRPMANRPVTEPA